MNTHITRHLAALSLCLMAFSTTSGCAYVADLYYRGDYEAKQERVEELRATHEKQVVLYNQRLAGIKERLPQKKEAVERALKQREVSQAVKALSSMDLSYGDIEGASYGESKERNIRIKEGIDESAYINKASTRVVTLVDELIKEGDFKALDVQLTRAKEHTRFDKGLAQELTQRHENLNKIWLGLVMDDMQRLMSTHPAAALVYGMQAIDIAESIKDTQTQKSLEDTVRTIARGIRSRYGFTFTLGPTSGPHAQTIAKSVRRASWGRDAITFSSASTDAVSGVLSFFTSAPSFRPSQSKSQKSFRYKSGTQQIANPAVASIESRISSLESDVRSITDSMNNQLKSASKPCSGEGSQLTSCKSEREQRRKSAEQERSKIKDKQSDINDKRKELARTPKTTSKDVFAQFSYPVTTYTMSGSMRVQGRMTLTRGQSVTLRATGSGQKSDSAHAAHQKNGEGVGADRANPPTETSVLSSVVSSTSSKVLSTVRGGLFNHRAFVYDQLKKTTKEDQLNALAIFMILSPSNVPKEYNQKVEELSKVSNLSGRLSGL